MRCCADSAASAAAQYAQFADAFVLGQDFRQRRGRPAAAGQFRIERGKAGRHAGAGNAA
jgi:hypothetical protein